MKKASVLILGADGTQTLPIVESLHGSYEMHGFFRNKLSYGYASRYFNCRKLIHPETEADYIQLIRDYVEKNNIDVLFPMSDKTAELLSIHKEELSKIVKFVVPESQSFALGYDKNQLMHVCTRCNTPHPRTIDLDTTPREDISVGIFPALIKPNITTGGRGMTRVNTMDEFKEKYPEIHSKYGSCHLQEFIRPGGKQIKVQLFVDKSGSLLCYSVLHKQRFYPENGGSSSCNETIVNDDVVEMCHKVLREIHWEGFADFDLIEDPKDGVLKVMEINPRVPACVKSSIKSGADYANLYVDYALGRTTEKYTSKPGYKLRHIGFEMLWFAHSKNRWSSKPSWFRFVDSHLYFQDFSWKDPMPFLFGTCENLTKLFSPQFKKQKSGLR